MEDFHIWSGIIFFLVLFSGFLTKWVSYNWTMGSLDAKQNFVRKWNSSKTKKEMLNEEVEA